MQNLVPIRVRIPKAVRDVIALLAKQKGHTFSQEVRDILRAGSARAWSESRKRRTP